MHQIADMLIRIKNAYLVSHEQVAVPFSKIKFKIATLLCEQGYLAGVERKKKKTKKSEHECLELALAYPAGAPALNDLRLVSRSSRHLYARVKDLKPVRSGQGLGVVSTSQGIMTSKEAHAKKIGGEMLFEIW